MNLSRLFQWAVGTWRTLGRVLTSLSSLTPPAYESDADPSWRPSHNASWQTPIRHFFIVNSHVFQVCGWSHVHLRMNVLISNGAQNVKPVIMIFSVSRIITCWMLRIMWLSGSFTEQHYVSWSENIKDFQPVLQLLWLFNTPTIIILSDVASDRLDLHCKHMIWSTYKTLNMLKNISTSTPGYYCSH